MADEDLIIQVKEHLFAVEGQIYEIDLIGGIAKFDKNLTTQMRGELLRDTALQIGFLAALKSVLPYLATISGLHPNLKKLSVFDEDDQKRMDSMQRTLDWYKDNKGTKCYINIKDIKVEAAAKMYDAIEEFPDAWNENGKLKDDFIDKYKNDLIHGMPDMFNLDELGHI